MRHRARSLTLHFFHGLLMGGADVIPGVSGGTVALIIGIYERLIGSIRSLAGALAEFALGRPGSARRRISEVEWRLIIPLGTGIICALGIGAAVIVPLLERYPAQAAALFFGLITGSLPIPWRRIASVRWQERVTAVAATGLAFVLVGLPPREALDPSLPHVFGAAAVAICAMILPGISGAFLLLVLGLYETSLRAVRNLDVSYIAVFVLGAGIGIGLFSRLLSWLLERWHDLTMAALVGLMVGSLRALWPWIDDDRGLLVPAVDSTLPGIIALAALGIVVVTALSRWGGPAGLSGAGGPAGSLARSQGSGDTD